MKLAGWTLALAMLGLDVVVLTRVCGADRHCDFTRPGVEPYWDDEPGEVGERVTPAALQANGRDRPD
jgi:hypothetical protein